MERIDLSPASFEEGDGALRCPNCGSQEVTTALTDDTFRYGVGTDAVELTARVPLRTCAACGFHFLDAEAEAAQHEAVCRHLGVMTPAEVKGVREKYGLSRAEFARVTRLGEAPLGRWERGALIQNAAYDRFLYLLRFPENFERLRARDSGNGSPGAADPVGPDGEAVCSSSAP